MRYCDCGEHYWRKGVVDGDSKMASRDMEEDWERGIGGYKRRYDDDQKWISSDKSGIYGALYPDERFVAPRKS